MAGGARLSAGVEIAERGEIVRYTLQNENGYGRDNSTGSTADADIARNMIEIQTPVRHVPPPKQKKKLIRYGLI